MAAGMTKTQLVRHIAEKHELSNKQVAALMESSRRSRDQRDQEERRIRSAGLGPPGEIGPQGAHRPQPADRRSHQDSAKTVVKFRVAKAVKDTIAPAKK